MKTLQNCCNKLVSGFAQVFTAKVGWLIFNWLEISVNLWASLVRKQKTLQNLIIGAEILGMISVVSATFSVKTCGGNKLKRSIIRIIFTKSIIRENWLNINGLFAFQKVCYLFFAKSLQIKIQLFISRFRILSWKDEFSPMKVSKGCLSLNPTETNCRNKETASTNQSLNEPNFLHHFNKPEQKW